MDTTYLVFYADTEDGPEEIWSRTAPVVVPRKGEQIEVFNYLADSHSPQCVARGMVAQVRHVFSRQRHGKGVHREHAIEVFFTPEGGGE